MKKTIQIMLGILSLLGIIAIAKNNYIFSNADNEYIEKGWKAYENKDYNYAISNFKFANPEKHFELLQVLGECYYNIDSINEAIYYLENAFVKSKLTKEEIIRIQNLLGICYIQKNNFNKAKYYLAKSKKLNDSASFKIIHFLDSLEKVQKNAPDINQ
ncbi:hypothetical protein [uncultured Apibacter sp.]|uniref:hypothetical protein n=1 Tax=uncultured Apibacter sp. TaxID=1778616 RepID=UPI0025F96105|nr:hypothetical protein [uncultured Apibacter sp.]